jgi:hypothetical protein
MSASHPHICHQCGTTRPTAERLSEHIHTHHEPLPKHHETGLAQLWPHRLRLEGIDVEDVGPIAPGECVQCDRDRRGVVTYLCRSLCVDCVCARAKARVP